MTDYHPEHTAAIEELMRQLDACDVRTAALEAQLAIATKALKRYAKPDNWRRDDWNVIAIFQPDYGDGGGIANRALKRIEKLAK
jgi:hypothetical protein